jgi:PBSX family phage terminase large subunit
VIYQKLSKRQKLAMLWWQQDRFKDRDALICDGSVRSGKSVSMTVGFVLWSMSSFREEKFAICGKTVESLRRNIVLNLREWLPSEFTITEKRAENKVIISTNGWSNTYFLFGGKDEASYMLIQGITLAGVLLDEVALMPKSFVDQACARCSVPNSKLWFNCNPAGPEHWFYKEWVLRQREKNALHIHFTMDDNLSLSAKIKERYERMFSGVFYDRYVRGLWVLAEGLIYPNFNESCISKTEPRDYSEYVVSMDYGIQNATSMGLWGKCGPIWYRVKEFYHSGRDTGKQKTDQEYYDELERLVGDLPVRKVIIDPSATSFIALIHQKKRFVTWRANNSVIDGIQHTASCLQDGTIKINDCCVNAIREFGLYRWDEKKTTKDEPVKENDHAMDEIRYFVNTTGVWRKKKPYQSIFVTG